MKEFHIEELKNELERVETEAEDDVEHWYKQYEEDKMKTVLEHLRAMEKLQEEHHIALL